MISTADSWCALNSTAVQALVTGGLIGSLALVVAPFLSRDPLHQPGNPAYKTARARALRTWARVLAPVTFIAWLIAVSLFTILYVQAGGKACADLPDPSKLNPSLLRWLYISGLLALAFLAAIAVLRSVFDTKNA
jgi:hypothetical protein